MSRCKSWFISHPQIESILLLYHCEDTRFSCKKYKDYSEWNEYRAATIVTIRRYTCLTMNFYITSKNILINQTLIVRITIIYVTMRQGKKKM